MVSLCSARCERGDVSSGLPWAAGKDWPDTLGIPRPQREFAISVSSFLVITYTEQSHPQTLADSGFAGQHNIIEPIIRSESLLGRLANWTGKTDMQLNWLEIWCTFKEGTKYINFQLSQPKVRCRDF